ncbi:hypothetical protein [Paenibacillus sp. WLX2291]|uniref:hypothetical protein n=1 Tax=Paenibacillus sp. WLX2291 TaxID=3296934 RepID=UPI0039845F68
MATTLQDIEQYGRQQGWWYDEAHQPYGEALRELGLAETDEVFIFFTHAEDGPTFHSARGEMYHWGWFMLHSDDVKLSMIRMQELGIDDEYIPLNSFAGDGGHFYNRRTGQVLYLQAGELLQQYLAGQVQPQWETFAAYLGWYFQLN